MIFCAKFHLTKVATVWYNENSARNERARGAQKKKSHWLFLWSGCLVSPTFHPNCGLFLLFITRVTGLVWWLCSTLEFTVLLLRLAGSPFVVCSRLRVRVFAFLFCEAWSPHPRGFKGFSFPYSVYLVGSNLTIAPCLNTSILRSLAESP